MPLQTEVGMDHTRHIAIFDAAPLSISLVGAGGIGAMTALMLAKMGVGDLVIYDGDVISPENLPTQLHRLETEGEPKVDALAKTLALFSDDTRVYPVDGDVVINGEPLGGKIVISGVDSIAARKVIWDRVRAGHAAWYLDARMSAEEFHLYAVDLNDPLKVAKYEKMISAEDDSRIAEIACTQKATFYCAAMASGHIGSAVRKIATAHKPAYYVVHNIFHDKLMVLER